MRAVDEPWGGGNSWLWQMTRHLRAHGYDTRSDLRRSPGCVVLVDPRVGGNVGFGADEIARVKQPPPGTPCLHRINECDLRKGTNEIDALLADANRVADHTVFISGWLRDYFAARGWATEHTFYSKRSFLRDAVASRPELVPSGQARTSGVRS